MPWNDSSELVVANTGQIYVAPVGTTLPTRTSSRLDSAFVGLGYTTEDGVTFTATSEIRDFRAWQSRQPIRREMTSQEVQASFTLQQWNENNVPLAFGGGRISDLGGGDFRYDPPEDTDALDERVMVIDVVDGDIAVRFVIVRGNVTDAVESSFQRDEAAVLPITFRGLEPEAGGGSWYWLTNSTGFAAGS